MNAEKNGGNGGINNDCKNNNEKEGRQLSTFPPLSPPPYTPRGSDCLIVCFFTLASL